MRCRKHANVTNGSANDAAKRRGREGDGGSDVSSARTCPLKSYWLPTSCAKTCKPGIGAILLAAPSGPR